MATTGPNYPTAFASIANGSSNPWSNMSNVGASDNSYSTANTAGSTYTETFKATGFNFSIPAVDTITGILLEVEIKGAGIQEFGLQLTKDGTTLVGTNRQYSNSMTGSDVIYSYGSLSNLWGTTWTPAEINAATFGLHLALIDGNSTYPVVSIDQMRITIGHTPPATGGFFGLMRKAWKWLSGKESEKQTIEIIRPLPAFA